jgi:hypothetical protein
VILIAWPLINHKFIDNNLELNEKGHNILSINNISKNTVTINFFLYN